MGTIVMSGLSPHPPIMLPEIGGAELRKCMKSRLGLQEFSRRLAESGAEALVLFTPHGPVFRDALTLYAVKKYAGSFSRFGFPSLRIESPGLPDLANRIFELSASKRIPILKLEEDTFARHGIPEEIDHATMVPLRYFEEAGVRLPMVLVSMGLLPYPQLFEFGRCVAEAIASGTRKVAVVASGDLSHRLLPSAPAGFDPIGAEFDEKMVDFLSRRDAAAILGIDETLIERAGECGFRPIAMMLGATDTVAGDWEKEVISYEGPFGVGYAVVSYRPAGRG